MLRNLKPKRCMISKPSFVCGSLNAALLCLWTRRAGLVPMEKKEQTWRWWGKKPKNARSEQLSLGTEEEKTKERGYSLRLHEETGLEIRVGTQPREGQTREFRAAGIAGSGRGSTDEGAKGWVSEGEEKHRKQEQGWTWVEGRSGRTGQSRLVRCRWKSWCPVRCIPYQRDFSLSLWY